MRHILRLVAVVVFGVVLTAPAAGVATPRCGSLCGASTDVSGAALSSLGNEDLIAVVVEHTVVPAALNREAHRRSSTMGAAARSYDHQSDLTRVTGTASSCRGYVYDTVADLSVAVGAPATIESEGCSDDRLNSPSDDRLNSPMFRKVRLQSLTWKLSEVLLSLRRIVGS